MHKHCACMPCSARRTSNRESARRVRLKQQDAMAELQARLSDRQRDVKVLQARRRLRRRSCLFRIDPVPLCLSVLSSGSEVRGVRQAGKKGLVLYKIHTERPSYA